MSERVGWVDVAKGITIVLVVMLHSTLGVEKAAGETGWLGQVVEFTRPFRMPDFFLIAGLFLAGQINAPWRRYLDRKVVHFAYFYLLWLTIQFAFKAPTFAAEMGWDGVLRLYLLSLVEPFGSLWFIYHLALFMLVTRLVRNIPWPIVWVAAAALEILPIETGWTLIDEFAGRFVYFYSGYIFATWVFRFADVTRKHLVVALTGFALWASLHGLLVFGGYSKLPLVSLGLGFAGALAVVAVSVFASGTRISIPLRWLGERSIVVYLAFFLPMMVSRIVLMKTGIIADVGTISLLVTIAGVLGPVVLYALIQWTGWCRFLFERPAWARLEGASRRPREAMVPAE